MWVGGMFFAYVVLRPSLSVLEPPQRIALHSQVFRRFFLIIWHVMPVIVLTGFIMIFAVFGGMAGVALAGACDDAAGSGHGGDLSRDLFWSLSHFPRVSGSRAA